MAKNFIAAQPSRLSPDTATQGHPQITPEMESLRRLMTLALFGAGIVCTLGAAAMVLIVWLGGWSPETQPQRLEILGWALLGMLAGILAVIISFAIGGPVGRLSGSLGLASFSASALPDAVSVTTETTVETGKSEAG